MNVFLTCCAHLILTFLCRLPNHLSALTVYLQVLQSESKTCIHTWVCFASPSSFMFIQFTSISWTFYYLERDSVCVYTDLSTTEEYEPFL